MLRDLSREPPDAAFATIVDAAPDVLVLTDFDYDAGSVTLGAFAAALAKRGLHYPYLFAARPNGGTPTGRDLDGDGLLGGPRDAQGYGWFSGQGGQAILSRHPLRLVADRSDALWRDVPDSAIPEDDPGTDIQRLASTAFWAVAVDAPGGPVTLLTVGATPPVFDGPEDRNGRRNRDEVLFWTHVLDGPDVPPGPVALVGNLNLDPAAGNGWHDAVRAVLDHPRLQDPQPGAVTATWDSTGPMRVSYVLPDASLRVAGQGVTPPAEDAGPHALVWVDVAWP